MGNRLQAVSLPTVIEARFDDLTGAQPSFRLVEPVGGGRGARRR
jgi:hypothetical protein